MSHAVRPIAALTLFLALAAQLPAEATNGYFTHGIGVKNKAMAGAGPIKDWQRLWLRSSSQRFA